MAEDGTYYMPTIFVGTCIGLSKRAFGMFVSRKIKGNSLAQKSTKNRTLTSKIKGNSLAQKQVKKTIKVQGSVQQIVGVTLEFVVMFWREQAKKGNTIADALVDALLIESLQRRFDKAFGKAISEEEYNQQLTQQRSLPC